MSVRCITAVRVKPRLSTRGPVADVCVWAPGLRAPEPSPLEQRRAPLLTCGAFLSFRCGQSSRETVYKLPSAGHTRASRQPEAVITPRHSDSSPACPS